jgi:hypothetical protein
MGGRLAMGMDAHAATAPLYSGRPTTRHRDGSPPAIPGAVVGWSASSPLQHGRSALNLQPRGGSAPATSGRRCGRGPAAGGPLVIAADSAVTGPVSTSHRRAAARSRAHRLRPLVVAANSAGTGKAPSRRRTAGGVTGWEGRRGPPTCQGRGGQDERAASSVRGRMRGGLEGIFLFGPLGLSYIYN